jgi:hypothetical protein
MNGYQLTRRWFNFAFENSQAKVQHTALYCWMVELNNRLGWKDEFTINTQFTMEGLSIGNKNTYLAALADLEKWGFIKTIRPSINQNYGKVITLRCGDLATAVHTAMDMALIQESDGNDEGGVPIVKQVNQETTEPLNTETEIQPEAKPKKMPTAKKTQFVPPTYEQVEAYFIEHGGTIDKAEECYFYYKELDWHNKYGKKLSNWKTTMLNNWILKNQKSNSANQEVPPEAAPKQKARQFHESFTFTPNQ